MTDPAGAGPPPPVGGPDRTWTLPPELGEVIEGGRAAADATGRLTERVLAALGSSGILGLQLPTELGGADAPLGVAFEAFEQVAHRCGSAGWLVAFAGIAAAWPAARLDDEGVAEVCDGEGRWPTFAGTFVPSGRARTVPGGVRLSGRWGFASGVHHADWVVAGAVGEDGRPVWAVVPAADLEVLDTWHAFGLRGTGSCDYRLEDVFVPTRRLFEVGAAPRRGGPAHRLPMLAFLTPHHSAVSLGCARRAVGEALAAAPSKHRLGSPAPQGARGAFRRDAGAHLTRLAAAADHVRAVVARLDAVAAAGAAPDPDLSTASRAAATHAAEVAIGAATFAHRAGGAAALAGGPLDQAYRDALVATQHVHVDDEVYEARAAVAAGWDQSSNT